MDKKVKTKEEVLEFIRERLSFSENIESHLKYVDKDLFRKEHRRFEMSGYENKTGECTEHNMSIVNLFAYLGIYDYTHYLFLDFYKGQGTLYFQYFGDDQPYSEDLGGCSTAEIIFTIFEITILSDKNKRRRS
jgi:hypothetical protein